MRTRLFGFGITFILSLPVLAQSELVLPATADRAWGSGNASSAMIGQNTSRTQLIYASPFAPGTVVAGIGMRCAPSTVDRPSFTATVEIRVSSTTAVPGALSTTWGNNVGNDEVIVLPQQVVTIPAMPANRGTGTFAEFPFTTPFVFGLNGNPNICVDVTVYARSAGASWSTDRDFAGTNGNARAHGIGCGPATVNVSSTNGSYVDGCTMNFTLAGAPPGTIAALVPSIDQKEYVPGFPLPFPLSLIGAAPGCDLLVNSDLGLWLAITDGAGAASTSITLSGYSSFGMGAQWLYLVTPTASNPAGMETAASRAIWIGPSTVHPNAGYVWELFSATSATGSASTNAVPVCKFMLL